MVGAATCGLQEPVGATISGLRELDACGVQELLAALASALPHAGAATFGKFAGLFLEPPAPAMGGAKYKGSAVVSAGSADFNREDDANGAARCFGEAAVTLRCGSKVLSAGKTNCAVIAGSAMTASSNAIGFQVSGSVAGRSAGALELIILCESTAGDGLGAVVVGTAEGRRQADAKPDACATCKITSLIVTRRCVPFPDGGSGCELGSAKVLAPIVGCGKVADVV